MAFVRSRIVCRSPDQDYVRDLLKCSYFVLIPPHPACTEGIVRGVNTQLSPAETLEKLSVAGVVAVYRCNRVVNDKCIATESVIATFSGTSCPSGNKAWPLMFRSDQRVSRLLQRKNCWKFGRSVGGCKL